MAQGDPVNIMLAQPSGSIAGAATAINTAVSTLRANGAVVYGNKLIVTQSGTFASGVVAATGAASGYVGWAMVQYLSAV